MTPHRPALLGIRPAPLSCRSTGYWIVLIMTVVAFAAALPANGAQAPHRADLLATTLENFESGHVTLVSADPAQDLEPNAWEVTSSLAYGGSQYSLRLHGNTWKAEAIAPHPVTTETVFQVAAFVQRTAEMQAFGVSDGTNTLYYTVAGTQLPTTDDWIVVYQGAFPDSQWNLYLLPVGRDWHDRFGYDPMLTRLVYVNDRDIDPRGEVFFDSIADVTEDLPQAPSVEIVRGRQSVEKLSQTLYRVGIQFGSQATDADTPLDSLAYSWTFGDGGTSTVPNPFHDFLVQSDHTYTVTLSVRDPQGLWGRDTTQVRVDPGAPDVPVTMNFVGDVMLARGYDAPGGLIDQYGPEWMFIPTKPYYGDAADLSLCNLECPFTDEGVRHPTKSITFRARPTNITGISFAGIDAVSLGNNHIIDYGQRGMEETQEVLDGQGIPWAGADDDEYLALQPIFLNERGVSLAMLGQCNRTGREYNYQPFLDAGYEKPGFAYEIDVNLDRAIAGARALADLTVMQLHGGIEYATGPRTIAQSGWALEGSADAPRTPGWYLSAPRPIDVQDPRFSPSVEPPTDVMGVGQVDGEGSGVGDGPGDGVRNGEGDSEGHSDGDDFIFPTRPSLTDRQLRWRAIDDGADLLICHHPHVLQGFEVYNGVLIAHSMGNFVFDQGFAETYPSIILETKFDKQGFREFTFRPAFVDDWIPHVVTGRLGREILDRQAEYSRELGAVVTVDPTVMKGTIHIHPENLQWTPETFSRTAPLVASEGGWTTPPLERPGLGVLSRILPASGAPGAIEVRVGREMAWHGDFEDEGATFWDLNSSYETYDESVAHQGQRSLRLQRADGTSAVSTTFEGYPALLGGLDYSLSVWMKTSNVNKAVFSASLYTGRGGGLIGTFTAGDTLSGTHDWTYYWRDYHVGNTPWFFNLRARIDRPLSSLETAWFDEARLVAWDDWQPLTQALSVPYPSNYRFLQFRSAEAAGSLQVSWEDVRGSTVSVGVDEQAESSDNGSRDGSAGVLFLSPPCPTPASSTVALEYSLARAGQVRLEIFDASGRRVALLLDAEQSAGSHREVWGAEGVPSGVYFARCQMGAVVKTERVVLTR